MVLFVVLPNWVVSSLDTRNDSFFHNNHWITVYRLDQRRIELQHKWERNTYIPLHTEQGTSRSLEHRQMNESGIPKSFAIATFSNTGYDSILLLA